MSKKEAVSFFVGFFVCLFIVLILNFSFFNLYREENIPLNELVSPVRGTGSMLPAVSPDTLIDSINFNGRNFNGRLKCGHAYIFEKEKENITHRAIHRFVYESNNGSIYFKGDNNQYWDDPVTLNQVIEEVVGYRWD